MLAGVILNSYSEFVFKFNAIQNFYNAQTKDSFLFKKTNQNKNKLIHDIKLS